jgi:predicted CXXCH cytochrome family protein
VGVAVAALVLCCALRAPAAVAAAGPVLVFPPDKALLIGDGSIDLLGYRPAGPDLAATVTGKGGTRSFPVAAGAFSVKVKLDAGENRIEFGGSTATVFVGGADAAGRPAGFSPPDRHAVDNGCEECHAFSATGATLVEKVPALCGRCHDDVLKGKDGKALAVLHPPAEEGDCLSCHGFHKLAIREMAPADRRALCFGCHDDFTGGGKKRMHGPVAKGDCTGCHGPHGAAGAKLLPATGVKLCVLCHADPSHGKDGKEWGVTHPALDDGCASCHLAHVADVKGMLKKPQAELCADCHDPFPAQAGGKDLVRHSPVEEGECTGCHKVHGSDVKKLLAADGTALCASCHGDPGRGPDGKEWPVPHPALDDGCLSCHLPHVGPVAGLLKKPQAPLCFGCHDPIKLPEGGGSIHRPIVQGRCAGCHAPHGSAVKKILKAEPSRALCLLCHKDPARTPDGGEWPVPHPALDDGCGACHLPHVAAAPRLLAKPQGELCAGCHEDKNLNANGSEWATPHAPVAKGLCASCHGPHGAPEKALLRKNAFELCQGCHTEPHTRHISVELDPTTGQPVSGAAVLPAGFPVRKKDGALACAGCHRPHGSDNARMWPKPEQQFCGQCHSNY